MDSISHHGLGFFANTGLSGSLFGKSRRKNRINEKVGIGPLPISSRFRIRHPDFVFDFDFVCKYEKGRDECRKWCRTEWDHPILFSTLCVTMATI
jgi:hypothetical protein